MPSFLSRPPRSRCLPAPLALLAVLTCTPLIACDEGVSSDPEIPVDITVRLGDGTAESITFPEVALGAPTRVQTATVVNRGHIKTPRLAIEVVGDGAASFHLAGNCQDAELAPGATCAIELTAVPASLGALSATLRVRATARVAVSVPLRGSGRGTNIQLTVGSSWEAPPFPPMEVGVEKRFPIHVAGYGNGPLDALTLVLATRSPGVEARVERASEQPGCTISEERTCGDELVVRPTAIGPFTVTVEARAEGERAELVVERAGAGRIAVTTTGNGHGYVGVVPNGSCGDRCVLLATAPIDLVANPNPGSELVGWTSSDSQCTTRAEMPPRPPSSFCHVVPSLTPIEIGAAFAIDQTRTMTIEVSGDQNGYVIASRDDQRIPCTCVSNYSPCKCSFEIGERISLRAYTPSGFGGWSEGPCPHDARQCTITIAKDVGVAASFTTDDATWTRTSRAHGLHDLVAFEPDGGLETLESDGNGLVCWGRDGKYRWSRGAPEDAMGLGVAATGNTYLLSGIDFGSRGYEVSLARHDQGTDRWRRVIDGAQPTRADTRNLLAVSPTGDVVIAVEIATPAGPRTLVRAYDAAGAIVWSDVSDAGPPVAIAVTAKGVTHVLAGTAGHRVLRSLASSGAVLPALPLPVLAPSDDFQSLAIDADAHIVLASHRAIDAITEAGTSAFHIDVAAGDDDQVMIAAGPVVARVDANRASPSAYHIATYDLAGALLSERSGQGQPSDVVAGGDDLWLSDVAVAADGAIAVTGLWRGHYDYAVVRLYAP